MMRLKVFYHVYIPEDLRACAWIWNVDQQLQLIKASKLHLLADVHMMVTMPIWWTSLFGSNFIDAKSCEVTTFSNKVKEYVFNRYSWVKEVQVRDLSANIFEGSTLAYFHKMSMQEDFLGLYIHAKGIIPQASPSVANWREILNHYLITEWCKSVNQLQYDQVVAINDGLSINAPVVSGNFFWARSDYVKTLPDPIQSQLYTHSPDLWPDGHNYRYAFELWILHNKPRVHYLCDTKVNHYSDYCFLENLLKTE